jgi:hypothetical protein
MGHQSKRRDVVWHMVCPRSGGGGGVGGGSAEISGGEIWDSKRPQQPQSSLSEQRAYITRPQQQTYSFLEHCLKTRSKTRTQTGIRMSYDRFLPPQTASTAPSNQRRTTIVLPTQLRQI